MRDFPQVSARSPCPGAEPFVGRSGLLSGLRDALQRSEKGGVSVVLVGEAGTGKTSLARRFAEEVKGRGAGVLSGTCYGVDGAPPYLPFREITQRAGFAFEPFSRSGRSAYGFGGPAERFDPEEARAHLLNSVADNLQAQAERGPLMVVVEDVQWADTGTLLALNVLVDRRAAGLLIVTTVRLDEWLEDQRRRLVGALVAKSERLEIGGLDRHEVGELAAALYGPGYVSDGEVSFLHEFTRGNPLFVRELLRHVQKRGLPESGSLERVVLRDRLPAWLGGLIDLRFQALTPEARSVLSCASVIGDEFSVATIRRASGKHSAFVADALEAGLAEGLVRRIPTGAEDLFAFAHPLHRKRLYETLAPGERRRTHARLGRAALRGLLDLSAVERATHLARSEAPGLMKEALRACRVAAKGAEVICAYETAAWYWELALRCAPRRRRTRAVLLTRLGWALWASREWVRAGEAWRAAVKLFEAAGRRGAIGPIALALGEMERWQQNAVDAESWLRVAVDALPQGSPPYVRALALLGSVTCLRDEPAAGLPLLARANRANCDRKDPYVDYWLSYGYTTAGDHDRAKRLSERALPVAEAAGDGYATTLLASQLVHMYLSDLQPRRAIRVAAVMKRAVSDANLMGQSFLLICESLIAAYRGRWNRVIQVCDRTLGNLRLAGDYQFGAGHFFRAEARSALGDPAGAAAEMAVALPHLGYMRPAAMAHLARSLLRAGEVSRARVLARKAARLLLATTRMQAGRAVLGEVAAAVGESTIAERVKEELAADPRPLVLLYSPVSLERVLGTVASASCNWGEAIEHFECALAQLGENGARGEMLATYRDYAEMRRRRRRRGDLAKAAALELRGAELRERMAMPPQAPDRLAFNPSRNGHRDPFALTGRQLEVLRLVVTGRSNNEIGDVLFISPRTVERHLEEIMSKMGVDGRVEVAVRAVELGLAGA